MLENSSICNSHQLEVLDDQVRILHDSPSNFVSASHQWGRGSQLNLRKGSSAQASPGTHQKTSIINSSIMLVCARLCPAYFCCSFPWHLPSNFICGTQDLLPHIVVINRWYCTIRMLTTVYFNPGGLIGWYTSLILFHIATRMLGS